MAKQSGNIDPDVSDNASGLEAIMVGGPGKKSSNNKSLMSSFFFWGGGGGGGGGRAVLFGWALNGIVLVVRLQLGVPFYPQSTLEDMDMEDDVKTLVSDEIKRFRESYKVGAE
jgi:hypothetical protein